MANLHVGHHIVHVSRSIVELGLVEVIWAITAISVATLIIFV
jgi:hypothetical protein